MHAGVQVSRARRRARAPIAARTPAGRARSHVAIPPPLPPSRCTRLLDLFLDKLSLDASTCTGHLLDPNFGGVFDADELALRSALIRFQRRLLGMPGARSSPAFGIVAETLRQLGHPAADPGADPVEREAPLHALAEARGDGRGDGARY